MFSKKNPKLSEIWEKRNTGQRLEIAQLSLPLKNSYFFGNTKCVVGCIIEGREESSYTFLTLIKLEEFLIDYKYIRKK